MPYEPTEHHRALAGMRAYWNLQRQYGIRTFVATDEPWRPSLTDTGTFHGPTEQWAEHYDGPDTDE